MTAYLGSILYFNLAFGSSRSAKQPTLYLETNGSILIKRYSKQVCLSLQRFHVCPYRSVYYERQELGSGLQRSALSGKKLVSAMFSVEYMLINCAIMCWVDLIDRVLGFKIFVSC